MIQEELHNLKLLYYSQDSNNRALAREIIKGDSALKETLFNDVRELYNSTFSRNIKKVSKTTQELIYQKIHIENKYVNIHDRNVHGDVKYLKPQRVKISLNEDGKPKSKFPDYIWDNFNLKHIVFAGWGSGITVNIPEKVKGINILTIRINGAGEINGIENLPNTITSMQFHNSNIKRFHYDYIKGNSKLRYLKLMYNKGIDFDHNIFYKTQLTHISLDGCGLGRLPSKIGNYHRQGFGLGKYYLNY